MVLGQQAADLGGTPSLAVMIRGSVPGFLACGNHLRGQHPAGFADRGADRPGAQARGRRWRNQLKHKKKKKLAPWLPRLPAHQLVPFIEAPNASGRPNSRAGGLALAKQQRESDSGWLIRICGGILELRPARRWGWVAVAGCPHATPAHSLDRQAIARAGHG